MYPVQLIAVAAAPSAKSFARTGRWSDLDKMYDQATKTWRIGSSPNAVLNQEMLAFRLVSFDPFTRLAGDRKPWSLKRCGSGASSCNPLWTPRGSLLLLTHPVPRNSR